MINKITVKNVASYRIATELSTDKKVNLIYGLNGTGKSTLSNYLYDIKNLQYAACTIEGLEDDEVLVYNQLFVRDNFYEMESLNGIFTLSKENKDAKLAIDNAEKIINNLIENKKKKDMECTTLVKDKEKYKESAQNVIWNIKKEYTGGDRILEFCLENLKGTKEKLFEHILGIKKPEKKPEKTLELLKTEAQALGQDSKFCAELDEIIFSAGSVENEELFTKEIVGNKNSSVAGLIEKLGNSDWVKTGLTYISPYADNTEFCPFCQRKTITSDLLDEIEKYFDETYEQDIKDIRKLQTIYQNGINSLPAKNVLEGCICAKDDKLNLNTKYDAFLKVLNDNINNIDKKLQAPSGIIELLDSVNALVELNAVIKIINLKIREFNDKLAHKEIEQKKIKNEFWNIMRWEYDQSLSAYNESDKKNQDKLSSISNSIREINAEIIAQRKIIGEHEKKTINIEEAIKNINGGLLDLGIEDIKIKKHDDNGTDMLYKIVREETEDNIFKTLSEGEKMVISFLYFIELCKGKKQINELSKKKIIVIDDPISSLSHVYVFNVGRLIQNEFLRTDKFEQIFILTHSLYFFYELADMNKNRREENQRLFRLNKNNEGSKILNMRYEEIQNDYQAYWYIVKDSQQPAALIANCMRNIIEYFFNFVEKKDLNNVFQKPELQERRFQSFNRYINRESHSLGQNIFDMKEFNYQDFKDAFVLVFVVTGYEEHYKKMIR